MRLDTALLSRSPGETRVALLSRGMVQEFHLFRDSRPQAGDIVRGRSRGRLRQVAAALVDIGGAEPGFLPLEDVPPGIDVGEGAVVLVEVVQEPRADKGAKLTAAPSLAGALLAYTPFRPGAAISAKLTNRDERTRLETWAREALAAGEGAIVRTRAFDRPLEELDAELASLRADWAALTAETGPVPQRLRGGAAPLEAALAGRAVDVVWAEGPGAFVAARDQRPDLTVKRFDGGDLFDEHGIDEQLEVALARRLTLPGGARLTIDETAALTAIDVDTGPLPAEEANRLAVVEIARQLRLRALAGQIVVDFAAPRRQATAAKRALADALRERLTADPVPTHVLGVSALGLVELRRERRRPPLADLLLSASPVRPPHPEAVALDALRRLQRAVLAAPATPLHLTLAPVVAALLDGPLRPARAEAERALGGSVTIVADPAAAVGSIVVGSR